MTRLNWEKARSRDRYFRSVFGEHGNPFGDKHFPDEFDINNPDHNPLRLTEDMCRGQIPSATIRSAIFKFLIQKDRGLRDRYSGKLRMKSDDLQMSSKEFLEFSYRILIASLDWPSERCPLEIAMPVAVCFSIAYLNIYNMWVPKNERAKYMTPEIYKKLQEMSVKWSQWVYRSNVTTE